MDFKYLITATRSRIYLLWAILVPIGFVATHFYQNHNINFVWTIIALIGLGYMYSVMPLRVTQVRRIFLTWVFTIVLGIIMTGAAFYVHTQSAAVFITHLGAFWLAVMAVGYIVNALFDRPALWYVVAFILNVGAAAACYEVVSLAKVQYLVAALVAGCSMLLLWLFHSGE